MKPTVTFNAWHITAHEESLFCSHNVPTVKRLLAFHIQSSVIVILVFKSLLGWVHFCKLLGLVAARSAFVCRPLFFPQSESSKLMWNVIIKHGETLEQVAQRNCGTFICGHTQNPPGSGGVWEGGRRAFRSKSYPHPQLTSSFTVIRVHFRYEGVKVTCRLDLAWLGKLSASC